MLHGVALSRFLHDTTHSQLLGTSKVLNGSILTYLVESGMYGPLPDRGFYEHNMKSLLRFAFLDFKTWLRLNQLKATQPRFTPSRLNRKHRGMYPCLAGKAVNGKRVSFWLAQRSMEWGERVGATAVDKEIAICMWAYCSMLRAFDQSGLVCSREEAGLMYEHGNLFLLSYAHLRARSATTRGKVLLRSSFAIIPKHHYLQHALEEAKESLINPGLYNLLAAESWVGFIGRISRSLAFSTGALNSSRCYRIILSKVVLDTAHCSK